MSRIPILLLVLVSHLLLLTSCRKDPAAPTIQEELPGTWTFISLTLDGQEFIGNTVDSAFFVFGPVVAMEGAFEQRIHFQSGNTDHMTGRYVLNQTMDKLTMTSGEKTIMAMISINRIRELRWAAEQDGKPLVVKARQQ